VAFTTDTWLVDNYIHSTSVSHAQPDKNFKVLRENPRNSAKKCNRLLWQDVIISLYMSSHNTTVLSCRVLRRLRYRNLQVVAIECSVVGWHQLLLLLYYYNYKTAVLASYTALNELWNRCVYNSFKKAIWPFWASPSVNKLNHLSNNKITSAALYSNNLLFTYQ